MSYGTLSGYTQCLFFPSEDCAVSFSRIGSLVIHGVGAACSWALADVCVCACGHEHELFVEVVLPEKLFCLVLVGGEAHVASYAVTGYEDVTAIFALEDDFAVSAVDDAELRQVSLVFCVCVIDESMGRCMHWQACGEVDDAECLAVWDVACSVGFCLIDSEVVKFGIAAIAPVLVEGEERKA